MNAVNEESSAKGANLQRVVMCTESADPGLRAAVEEAMQQAGLVVELAEPRKTFVIRKHDLPEIRVYIAPEPQHHFGRKRKKGGFRRYT